uniref:FPL domain-containing protein n=1 Tax=Aureoumbra lagunensis TaxID=44058 RepID=A0A7S3JXB7_9STRA
MRKLYQLNELVLLCRKLEERIHIAGENQVVEWIRQLAEIIIYGEQEEDARYFEIFIERQMLKHLVHEATRGESRRPRVESQVLQTLAILIQNVKSSHSLYLLLSSNHLNALIEGGETVFVRTNDETQAAFVALLKTISLRLDQDTVQFFIDNTASRFPLHDCAARIVGFVKDSMARTAALTTLLNIYKINDKHLHKFVHTHADTFLAGFNGVLETEFRALYAEIKIKRKNAVTSCAAQLHDLFYYAQDILLLDVLSQPLEEYLIQFFDAILRRPLCDCLDSARAACAAYVAALFVLALFSSSYADNEERQGKGVSSQFKKQIFYLSMQSLPLKKLLAGELGESVAASTLCLVDALRRLGPADLLKSVGLESSHDHYSDKRQKKMLVRGANIISRKPTSQAKAILETLFSETPALNAINNHEKHSSSLFDELGNEDEEEDLVAEKESPQDKTKNESQIRTQIRLGLLECLGHFENMSLGTLRAATQTLSTLPVAPDDLSYTPTILRPILARAATAYAIEVDDDRVFELDKAVAAFHDWCRARTSTKKRLRIQKNTLSDNEDDDDEDDDNILSPPTARLAPIAALLNREGDFDLRDPLHTFLAIAEAYSLQLVPTLLEHLLDAQPPLGSMRLAGKKCLPCSTLRPRLRRSRGTPPPAPHSIGESIDLFLVLDDASLILAVPDPLALSTGRVLAAAPLHAILALIDSENATKLDLGVAPPYNLESLAFPSHQHSSGPGKVRLTLIFDSEANCRVAYTFLADRRAAERDKRRQRLKAKLREIADPHHDLFPPPVLDPHSDLIATAPPRLSAHASSDPLVVT